VANRQFCPEAVDQAAYYIFDRKSTNMSNKAATESRNENPIKSPNDPPRDPSNQISS
jgi:hypothetical protein